LIDAAGDTIVPFRPGRYNSLPLVVGEGAEKKVKGFVDEIAAYPALAGKVRAYVRVGDRRWDLLLDNGVRIMLPETDPLKAQAHVESSIRSSTCCRAISLRSIFVSKTA
jgi:cell division protein FtsQ